MRKLLVSLCAVAAVLCFSLTSCKQELKSMRGQVADVTIRHDSLVGMKLLSGSDTLTFRMQDALIQNGMMMAGDSVIVDYIDGSNNTLRALVVTLLPKVAPIQTPMVSDTLVTIPVQKPEPEEPQAPNSTNDKK